MISRNYDMPGMRRELIALLSASLKKESKFYREDYENIVKATNRKTRAELIQAISNQYAINGVSAAEICKHCQV